MATVLHLVQSGQLFKLDPALGQREMELRCIFLLPRARDWLANRLPRVESDWNIEESPAQQLDALVYEFCVGQPLPVEHRFKALVHLANGIWELKTADLRLFGWFVRKDHFIVTDCDSAGQIKQLRMYRGYCKQAERLRNALDLDEPKFVAGANPNDVVSDCYFP